jgi:leader peptidase (prepilin peptidase)/N-methyltransferase
LTSASVCVLAAVADLPGMRRWLRAGLPVSVALSIALVLVGSGSISWSWPASVGWGVITGVLVVQVSIDLTSRTLPREVSYLGVLVAGPLLAVAPFTGGLAGMLVGAVAMTAITLMLFVTARGSLGLGDVHLSPLLGMSVGWIDPWLVPVAWLVTAVTGALVILALLAGGRIGRSSKVPYGPFMVAGTVIGAFIGLVRS